MALLSNTTVYGTLSGSGIIYDLTSNSLIWASGYSLASGINTQTGNYATTTNLAATGSTLDNKINNLSGYVTGVTGIFGSLPANLASTGSTLNSKINSLSGYVDSQDTAISNNLRTTGSTLDNKINSLSGNLTSTYSTITNLASTGSTLDSKINSLSGWSASASNLASSGSTLDSKINSLSGWSASATNLSSTGSNLNNSIISLSGLFTGYTGTLDATFATDAQLYTTGSTLDNKINSLSGNLTANYATITNLASTGSTLNTRINNLSGYINSSSSNIVFTTGDQTVSGNKTFAENTTFGDATQGDFLVISGNNFTVYGSGNFTSGLFVNGNAVLTGVDLTSYATKINLASTGSTLDNKINSLSGNLTGNYVTKSNGLFTNRPTVNGTNILLSGESIISGDLTGYLPYPTVNKLQGYKLDLNGGAADGQTLQWNAASSSWRAGAIPAGGNGGGGLVYYFNFANRSGIAPTGGLPTTGDHALSLLGTQYAIGSGQATSNELDPRFVDRLLCSFVTASGNPQLTNIPAGLWDFNIWASVDNASAIQCSIRAVVNIYNPTNSTYRYLSSSDDVYLYETDTIAQYILNATVPQTGIANNERIYIQLFGKKYTTNNRTITLYFDSYRPSHVHTTIPSVAGDGVVKVVNGVLQSPATGIFNSDVDNAANIAQSKIANLTTDLSTLRTSGQTLDSKINSLSGWSASTANLALTGSNLDTKINNVSGYINSSGSNIVFTTGDQTISGNKSFTSSSILSIKTISGFQGSSPDGLNLFGTNDNAVNASILLAGNINLTAGTGTSFGSSTYGNIYLKAGGPKYNGQVNLNGNINFNNDTIASTLGSRTISFYKTGMQFGNPSAVTAITIDNSTFSFLTPPGVTEGGLGLYISGVGVTPALYVNTTSNQTINGLKTFTSGIDIYSGTSPQSLRIFNSTGTNSGEFGLFGWQNNQLVIGSQATNSGISRDVLLTGNSLLLSGSNLRVEKGGDLYVGTRLYYNEPNGDLRLGTGPTHRYGFGTRSLWTYNDGTIVWNSTANVAAGSIDLILARDGAGIFAQRNGTNPQQFRVYNSTGTNSGEFGLFGWDAGNNLIIGSQATNSGILRNTSITGSNININSNSNINLNPSIANNGYVTLNGGSAYLMVVNGGVNQAALGKHPLGTYDGLHLTQGRYVTWSSSQINSSSPYLFLTDDGANTLAQRNPLSPLSGQQFRVYNATGTNSGEFGLFGWQNNNLIIGPQQTSSGILRNLTLTGNNINILPSGNLNISKDTIISGNLTVTGNLNSAGNYYVKVARLSNQTILNGTDTGIQFSSVTDPNSWYNASTYRITPTVSGNYVTNLMVNWQKGTVNNNQTNIQIRKNGNTIAINKSVIVTGDDFTSYATAITTLNGSSDYIDATAYTANPTSQVVNGTADGAWTKMELFKLN